MNKKEKSDCLKNRIVSLKSEIRNCEEELKEIIEVQE